MNVIKLILTFIPFISYAQKEIIFSDLKFDKVVMYDFEGVKGSGLYIINNGKLSTSVKKQQTLNKKEESLLINKLNLKSSYGGGTASCFDPHLGFVIYNKNIVVAHITICLDCNRLSSSITIAEQQNDDQDSFENKYVNTSGLSPIFRKFINELLIKYRFSHQIPAGSLFDSQN